MEYGKIINRSFDIAWKNKTLWLLGLFAGGTTSFNIDTGWISDDFEFPAGDWSSGGLIPSFDFEPGTIALMVVGFLLFFIVMMILHFISVAGLIDAANRIVRGGVYRLFDSISVGAGKLLRFVGLGVLLFVGGMICIIVLVMAVIGSFAIHDILGGMSLLFWIPLFLLTFLALVTIGSLAQRAIVVRDVSIGDGLEEAYYLFKNNLGKSAAILALYILLMIGIAILSFMVFGFPALLFGFLSQSWLVALLTIVIETPLMLILSGFVGTAMANIYTLFYFELLEPGILYRGAQISADSNPGILP